MASVSETATGPAAKYCQNCGQVNPRTSALCSRCGGTTFSDVPADEGVQQVAAEEREQQVWGTFGTVVRVIAIFVWIGLLTFWGSLWMISPVWKLLGWGIIGGVYFFVLHDKVVGLIARMTGRQPEEM